MSALDDASLFSARAIDAGIAWSFGKAASWLRVARQALAVAVAAGLEGDELVRADIVADRIARIAAILDDSALPADEEDLDIRLTLAAEALEMGHVAYLEAALEELEELAPHACPETRTRIRAIQTRARGIGRA